MEILQLTTQFTTQDNRQYHLRYSVFHEPADKDFPDGYSISVELMSPYGTETATAHRISNFENVCTLAHILCKNTVTPVTLDDVISDYITAALSA